MRRRLSAVGLLAAGLLVAAPGARPAAAQPAGVGPTEGSVTYAIRDARIVTLAGPPIARGTVVITDGRIAAVGADVTVPPGAEVIDADGLEVYPGLFDAISRLGLTEIGAVAATNDVAELGDFNPHLVAAHAVHPASEHLPVARANGLTHTLSVPGIRTESLVPGHASAIHLDGWTIEEMLVGEAPALVVNWPTYHRTAPGPGAAAQPRRPFREAAREQEERVRQLAEWIGQARHYAAAAEQGSPDRVSRDRRLEALAPVARGERPMLVYADREREIREAIAFAEEHDLRLILAGAADAYAVVDLLAEKAIPVVLGPVQALPSSEDEPYDIRHTTPGVLHDAGVRFALGTFDASDSRNLPYEIGNAVPYGLPWEAALAAITRAPAEIFGIDDRLGTIEVGKLGNLIVTDGDPLEIRTDVKHLFINGRPASLDNRHLRLYEQYRARPKAAGDTR